MSTTLSAWHLGLTMPNNVALNASFLLMDDTQYDLTRIFSVIGGSGNNPDYLMVRMYFDMEVSQHLPRFGVPKMVG